MRPSIEPSASIVKSLLYNEQKVTLHQAECILAENFLKDPDRLTWEDKVLRFERRQQLNERVTTNQHISLNFDPADILSNEKMQAIARTYMKELGFERQPYLVYRHYDAGHPHCHIVTTHIQANGDPIPQYKIGENQSEKARIRIEKEFDLVTAEKKRLTQKRSQVSEHILKVHYGERSTTRSISDTVHYVMEKANYTNLDEFNAILKLYNVTADPGKEGTRLRQHHGLLYRVLDEQGRYIGRPLKASFFDFKPTLRHLEEKFRLNQSLRAELQQQLEIRVRWELTSEKITLKRLENTLLREGIYMDLKKDKQGQVLDVIYVDIKNRCAIRADALHGSCHKEAVQKVSLRQDIRTESLHHRHRLRHNL
ncbi:MAG TPA: relaxase/mobilization nuclease domain-containing protein [Puia sp.]|nr:relaxase/mobilization nuclease domain-containing protein [Puia sp.]